MLKAVPIDDLKPGMYINQVLKQTGSLRMRSKGLVKHQTVINTLKSRGIQIVQVDFEKSLNHEPASDSAPLPTSETIVQASTDVKEEQSPAPNSLTRNAMKEANGLYFDAVNIQNGFLSALNRGAVNDLKLVKELAQSLIDSIFDNKDALSCLTLIKNNNAYLLEHSINCSILMGMFTQFLGYDRETIDQASLGALLMDVGMSSLPMDVHNSVQDLSAADWEVMKTHVDIGVELVEQCGDISDLVLSIIAQHHERIDGSGYPKALKDMEISEFARIAGIIDTYDAMVSNRPHKESISPTQALKRLTEDNRLDQTLVNQFVTCMGVHPVGSIVRLKSGKLAIVSQQNPLSTMSPIVMTFYSVPSQQYDDITRLDLSDNDDEIVSGVRPDDFNVNLSNFFQDVLVNQAPD
jgi:HD-GYP domain-containing protein (c-di-GMP phosphodiesterase class II)